MNTPEGLGLDSDRVLPCLIIGYSRFDGVIKNIHAARLAKVPKIYVSLDGPLTLEVSEIQAKILEQIKFLESEYLLEIIVRVDSNNQGVAMGVIGAIEWFFGLEEEGIILEDDLHVHDSFFDFCSKAVEVYRDNEDVWMICGSQYFPGISEDSVIWTSIPQIWGWATTREKWSAIRDSAWQLSKRAQLDHSFSKVNGFWSTGARRCLTGKVDTWDLLLVFIFILNQRFAIVPPKNLVSNVGYDSYASHTSDFIFPLGLDLYDSDLRVNWEESADSLQTQKFEKELYARVYRLSFKHRFSLLLSVILDWLRFPSSKRLSPLIPRWKKSFFTSP